MQDAMDKGSFLSDNTVISHNLADYILLAQFSMLRLSAQVCLDSVKCGRIGIRDLTDMMSTSKGGKGVRKADVIK